MKREYALSVVGFVLVALAYLASIWFVFIGRQADEKPGQIVIRIAHWQLESGLREAFQTVADEFTRLHPHIRIEQLAVPERSFPNWLVTQLIGGTAPDLIELGHGIDDDRTGRFFVPLSPWLDEVNPCNADTPLAELRWRDTFVDGLESSFNPTLLDYYCVPLNLHTLRLYYNKALYAKIMGPEALPPQTFAELEKVFARVDEFNRNNRRRIIPIAGSNYNGPILTDQFMSSQTQQLYLDLNEYLDWTPRKHRLQSQYLLGRWSFDTPPVQSGLSLVNELGRHMPQGFSSLRREDAAFSFLQERSLMIASGSWDIRSLKSQASFPIEVAPIPLPTRSDPRYGQYALGPFAESNVAGTRLGLTRQSRHPAEAIQFLQFVTSLSGDTLFSQTSLWIPAVIGAPIPKEITAFAPLTEGYLRGIEFNQLEADARLVINQNLYRLYGDNDPVESFIRAVSTPLRAAIRRDLTEEIKTRTHRVTRDDTTLAALLWESRRQPRSTELTNKLSSTAINQTETEMIVRELQTDLNTAPVR